MKIQKHTVPSITYTLKVDGEIIETAGTDSPLVYLHGVNSMIPGFERQLEGVELGADFDFKVTSEEGYGDINPDALVSLPKSNFEIEGKFADDLIQVGGVVPMQDQNGHPLRGIVLEITEDSVSMDFNHPLAGKELQFIGQVVDVRIAAEEEISHGHVHGEGGHDH